MRRRTASLSVRQVRSASPSARRPRRAGRAPAGRCAARFRRHGARSARELPSEHLEWMRSLPLRYDDGQPVGYEAEQLFGMEAAYLGRLT